ncbi:MAG: hypothetical protein EB829_01880 [Nitrosopumilus sp. H8]|nr:MAG: hypothetical protein EB829_01880 [Nitrosopumilus sp. H8]
MPDELSVVTENFVSRNVMADWYIPHVQKAHKMLIPSDITQVSHGSVEIRLDEEMTHDRDYIIFGDGNSAIQYHMFKKGDTVRLELQDEIGINAMKFMDLAFGRYAKFVHPTEEYVPSKLVPMQYVPPSEMSDIPETKWEKFAEYLRGIQLDVEPPSMREWLLDQGFSHTSVDSFLNEYPEFR